MKKYKLSCEYIEYQEKFGEFLTIEQAAFIAGIKPVIIKRVISHELIETVEKKPEPTINAKHIPKLKKVIRLHYDLGIGWNSMGLVLDLLDQVEKLENILKKNDSTHN